MNTNATEAPLKPTYIYIFNHGRVRTSQTFKDGLDSIECLRVTGNEVKEYAGGEWLTALCLGDEPHV